MKLYEKSGVAAVVFLALSAIFLYPIFNNVSYLGVRDWGYQLYMNTVSKEAVTEYGTVLLWDPWYHGGNPADTDAQNPSFGLSFLLVLLFDIMKAFKISLLIYLAIAGFGMWLLARKLGITGISSYLAGILFTFHSGIAATTIGEGHFHYKGFVWLPLIFYFFLKSREKLKYIIPSAIFLLLVILDNDMYSFGVISIILLVWTAYAVFRKDFKTLKLFVILFIIFAFIGAFRLLPIAEYSKSYPRIVEDKSSGYTFSSLFIGMFSSDQGPYSHEIEYGAYPGVTYNFFYYSFYIGWIAFILLVIGILLYWKNHMSWLVLFVVGLWISFGNNAIIPLYAFIKATPPYYFFHQAMRFKLMMIFPISIFAALALSRIEKTNKVVIQNKTTDLKGKSVIFVAIIVLIIFFQLAGVSRPTLGKVFIGPPVSYSPGEFYSTQSPRDSNPWSEGNLGPIKERFYGSVFGHRMLLNYMQNIGTINANIHQGINLSAQPKFFANGSVNSEYFGEAVINNKTITNVKAEPNRIIVETQETGLLIINQNYYPGWYVNEAPAEESNGLISTVVNSPGKIVFEFKPKAFYAGLAVSVAALFILILFFIFYDRISSKYRFLI